MKNKLILLSLVAAIVTISCGPKEEKPAEVIVIEQPTPEQPSPETSSGTSIEVGKDGVKIESNKTNVEVKDDGAKVKID
jgi:hypothetical protein